MVTRHCSSSPRRITKNLAMNMCSCQEKFSWHSSSLIFLSKKNNPNKKVYQVIWLWDDIWKFHFINFSHPLLFSFFICLQWTHTLFLHKLFSPAFLRMQRLLFLFFLFFIKKKKRKENPMKKFQQPRTSYELLRFLVFDLIHRCQWLELATWIMMHMCFNAIA